MKRASLAAVQASQAAAKRLCHLSMRYVGALIESVSGKAIGLLPAKHPGLHETRDLINLLLLCRAELNGLTRMLLENDLIDHDRTLKVFAEEYRIFGDAKAEELSVELFDGGISIDLERIRKKQAEGN